MATIKIETTQAEQDKVFEVIKRNTGKVIAVSRIAELAGMNQNRVRFVIVDLVENKRINRIPVKAFNARYIRYKYEVTK